MAILVTGGLGFIGSHTIVELFESNNELEVVILDNLVNSDLINFENIKKIIKQHSKIKFVQADLLDKESLESIFIKNRIESVIHFASLKSVGESVSNPLHYYNNNVIGTINLLDKMKKFGIKNLVFSSSATVYGNPDALPIKEDNNLSTTNPYGATKLFIEQILKDLYESDNSWNIAILRYFNPIGAHKSGLIGENPRGVPNNIMPYINKVAKGEIPYLSVFGDDYETKDGTGLRDYIHVVDLAKGHVNALKKCEKNSGIIIYNLGTGKGYTVLELVKKFEEINSVKIPFVITSRRPGDVAACYADVTKVNQEMNWASEKNIEDMCKDSWNFQTKKESSKS